MKITSTDAASLLPVISTFKTSKMISSASSFATGNGKNNYRNSLFKPSVLCCLLVIIVVLIHVAITTILSRSHIFPHLPTISLSTYMPSTKPCGNSSSTLTELTESRVLQITDNNRNLVYLYPPVDMIVMTMAKAGTSTLWHWIYPGITGERKWDNEKCKSYIHMMTAKCWTSYATNLNTLPLKKQKELLSRKSKMTTLKLAIQRNPYDRLISSFKSKFTCEHERFSTDTHDRAYMVPLLLKQAGIQSNQICMNITEFATALDLVKQNVKDSRNLDILGLDILDSHIKPQQFYFDDIEYDMIIDVGDLSDESVMKPIVDRLPFKDSVKNIPRRRHASGNDQLYIPEHAAKLLYSFALESTPGSYKYLKGAEPSTDLL